MRRAHLLVTVVLLLAPPAPAWPQASRSTSGAVADLPATCWPPGRVYVVTDGSSSQDCSVGGGSSFVPCACNASGTGYVSLDTGGAGSGIATVEEANVSKGAGFSRLDFNSLGFDVTSTDAGAEADVTLDFTEIGDLTWGNDLDSSIVVAFNPVGATSPTWTYTNGVANLSTGALQVGGVAVGDITAVGSMTSGTAFGDSTADDDWLGLGASAGRIEFDDLAVDEVNILASLVGLGTSTPAEELHVQRSASDVYVRIESTATNGTSGFQVVNDAVQWRVGVDEFDDLVLTQVTSSKLPFVVRDDAPTAALHINSGSSVFNESGSDQDLRVEGDTNANLFVVNAGSEQVGIGTAATTAELTVVATDGAGTPEIRVKGSTAAQFRLQSDVENRRFLATDEDNTVRSQVVFNNATIDFIGASAALPIDLTQSAGGHIESDFFAPQTGLLYLYDAAGGTSISDTGSDLTWDTEVVEQSDYTHSADGATVTINSTGLYRVEFECRAEQTTNGWDAVLWQLYDNAALIAGAEATGTVYSTNVARNVVSITILHTFHATDTLKVRATSEDSGTYTTVANECRLLVERKG